MKQFKALVRKDIAVHKVALLLPLFIVAGIYLLAGIIWLIAISKNAVLSFNFNALPTGIVENDALRGIISFGTQFTSFVFYIAIICGFAMQAITQRLFNHDIKYKCELFHRSQPVNIWKNALSRYSVGIGGFILVSLLLGIVNYLVINLFVVLNTPISPDWWMGLNGMLLGWLHTAIALLVIGSFNSLFSSLKKESHNTYAALSIFGIEAVIRTVNYLYGLGIPSLIKALIHLAFSGFMDLHKTALVIGTEYSSYYGKGPLNTDLMLKINSLPDGFLATMWGSLFTWDMVIKLLFSTVMIILSTQLYKRREVSF